MSIYANNYIVDEETLEIKLPKHLNKCRIDRGGWNNTPGGWNKSGKKARMRGGNHFCYNSKSQRMERIIKKLMDGKGLYEISFR